jgi:peptide/nickel transport system substrate-binding protein
VPTLATAQPRHAIAMHGEPALAAGFSAFRYVNRDAPKGGRFVRGVLGTFDSLNPFIVKGLAPPELRGYVFESLMVRGYDEPFTLYGQLARSVETNDERTYVTFDLDPKAAFADGTPVTAADVIFSWQLLRDHGRPNFRTYYVKVARTTALTERTVRFDLAAAGDRELPLILGLMPILPRHAVDPAHFEDTTLAPPLGSGPYVVAEVDPGRSFTLRRNPRYWGRDLAASGTSTRCASTSIATPTASSRPSKRVSTTSATRPIRAAGKPPMTFPRSATAAWSASSFRTGCRNR